MPAMLASFLCSRRAANALGCSVLISLTACTPESYLVTGDESGATAATAAPSNYLSGGDGSIGSGTTSTYLARGGEAARLLAPTAAPLSLLQVGRAMAATASRQEEQPFQYPQVVRSLPGVRSPVGELPVLVELQTVVPR